jgi:hypothetical protein
MTSPKRIRSPLTFSKDTDRRDAAVTDATFFSLLASTVQGDLVSWVFCFDVESHRGIKLGEFWDKEAPFLDVAGVNDSVIEKYAAAANNAVVVASLMVTSILCALLVVNFLVVAPV